MFGTIKAKDAIVWVNHDKKVMFVSEGGWDRSRGWCDPIGAAYKDWNEASDKLRVMLMQETAIELVTKGFDINDVLIEFAKVKEYFDLGRKSYPMCRAFTLALTGTSLEPNTMDFDDLLIHYGKTKRIKEHDQRVAQAMSP